MKALLILSGLGVLSLFAEIFNFKKILFLVVLAGLAVAFALNLCSWNIPQTYWGMMHFDNYAVAFTAALIGICFLWFLSSSSFFTEDTSKTDHYALILFALAGAVILTSFSNMTMLFLGVEILSIPMYVLAGSRKNDTFSNEAAFKYFLMGAFSTGFLLFGITLIYGASGSFDLTDIGRYAASNPNGLAGLFYTGVLLMLVGLTFKISAVPFHFWAPDVYQGSPTSITMFMATIVKTAAFAAIFRLFYGTFYSVADTWVPVITIMAVITMLLGNITAVFQSNVKRMLAWSSISHAGYMLLALVALNASGFSAVFYYTVAYSVGSIIAFSVLKIIIENFNSGDVSSFNGLAKKSPLLATVMVIALLSLAGIPPAAGFFAKYFIFTSALKSGFLWLVIIAVINSAIGVYYYFRIIIAMLFKEGANNQGNIEVSGLQKLVLILAAIITLVLGLFPDLIIRLL